MKILLSFFQDFETKPPHNIPAYRFWNYYMKNGIEEAQMQWVEVPDVDWVEGLLLQGESFIEWKTSIWEKTLKYIKENLDKIDIFLCYLYPVQIDANSISEIKKLGVPCINFYCDHIRDYDKVPKEFEAFDLMWVPEYEAIEMYKKAKTEFIHLPMPMWVDPFYRDMTITESHRVSFIGSKDLLREELLYKSIKKELYIEIRGAGWLDNNEPNVSNSTNSKLTNSIQFTKTHGISGLGMKVLQKLFRKEYNIPTTHLFSKPDFETYIRLTKESQITLGINRVPSFRRLHNSPLIYSRLRDIEAPMLGACYLTEHTKGIEYLYDIGKEIETYTNVDELVAKCKELTQSIAKRTELRNKGQKRALSSHSIQNSLNKIKVKFFN